MEKPVLILSAVEREQKYVKELSLSKNVMLKTCGIGAIEAGIQSAFLISEINPSAVYFLGSAGFYPNTFLSIGDVALGHIYRFGDSGMVDSKTYKPEIMNHAVENPTVCLTEKFSFKVKNSVVLTVPSITKNDELAIKMRDYFKSDVEHLEVYSIAKVCELLKIPFFSLLGLSNEVGIHSHQQWLDFQDKAVKNAGEVLGKLV